MTTLVMPAHDIGVLSAANVSEYSPNAFETARDFAVWTTVFPGYSKTNVVPDLTSIQLLGSLDFRRTSVV